MRLFYTTILAFCLFDGVLAQKYLLDEDVMSDTLSPSTGFRRKYHFASYVGTGYAMGLHKLNPPSTISYFNSVQFRTGIWWRMKLNKFYGFGSYIEYSRDEYRLQKPLYSDTFNTTKTIWTKQIHNNIAMGVFNRLHFKNDRLFIDLGAYYTFDCLPRIITKIKPKNQDYQYRKTIYNVPDLMNRHNFGLDFRLTFGKYSAYSRYRLTGLYKNQNYDLPKVMFGLVLDFTN